MQGHALSTSPLLERTSFEHWQLDVVFLGSLLLQSSGLALV